MTRLLRALFLPVSVLVLVAAALFVPLPYFVEAPGRAVSLAEQVTVEVPDTDAAEVDGDYLLLSVNLQRATTVGVLTAAVDRERVLVAQARILPRGVADQAYFNTQRHVFRTTADVAAAIGLAAAGYDVDPGELTGEGAEILRVVSGAPADGLLQPGDVVTAVGDTPVRTDADLRDAVLASRDGQSLDLRLRRPHEPTAAATAEGQLTVTIAPERVDPGDGSPRPFLGVELQTHAPRLELPVAVEVEAGRIGGPSAGLLIALTVYDKAAGVDLASGRRIAGTGGLDADGFVTPIGGIAQKVIAADREGADVFLAPAQQAQEARAARPADSALRVESVASFEDALAALGADPSAR